MVGWIYNSQEPSNRVNKGRMKTKPPQSWEEDIENVIADYRKDRVNFPDAMNKILKIIKKE